MAEKIVSEYSRLNDKLLKQPTLALLRDSNAPWIVAVLNDVFADSQSARPRSEVESRISTRLVELYRHGYGPLTPEQVRADRGLSKARELCSAWVRPDKRWLIERTGTTENTLELTSHTQAAREVIARTASGSTISASRITTLLSVAQRTVQSLSGEVADRMGYLDAEIERLTRERDDLAEGRTTVTAASDEDVLEAFRDIAEMVSSLPTDFRRIVETIHRTRHNTLVELRQSTRSEGAIIAQSVKSTDDLLRRSEEGRAFSSASALINELGLTDQLTEDLRTITDHPGVAKAVTSAEVWRVRTAVDTILEGVLAVGGEVEELTRSIKNELARFEYSKERAVDDLLRSIEKDLRTWAIQSRPHDKIDWSPGLNDWDVEYMPSRMWSKGDDALPPPVEHARPQAAPSAEELLLRGGPRHGALAHAVVQAAVDGGVVNPTAGQVLESLPDDLRRPVELGGMVDLAVRTGMDMSLITEREQVETVSRTGQRATYTFPKIVFNDAAIGRLIELYEADDKGEDRP